MKFVGLVSILICHCEEAKVTRLFTLSFCGLQISVKLPASTSRDVETTLCSTSSKVVMAISKGRSVGLVNKRPEAPCAQEQYNLWKKTNKQLHKI